MGSCGADCAISRVREREKEAALALAARLHPGLVWARRPAPPGDGSFDRLTSLGRALEGLLPVRAIVRAGDAAPTLDLLAGFADPALVEIADGARAGAGLDLPRAETYLRVAFSVYGRFATLQEVRVAARPVAASGSRAGVEIVEEPVAGVADRRLRAIVKGLQGALRRSGFTLLDMAFLGAPLAAGDQRAFVEDYGEAPTLWSLLFDPAPPTTVRASIAPGG